MKHDAKNITTATQLEHLPAERPGADLTVQTTGAKSVESMISAVIEKGVTSESVGVMERLVALYERMQDKDAEKQFAAAFNALQSEMPAVKAVKPVPNNDGSIRYKFAPYEEIMDQVRPLLNKHGFSVTFSMTSADQKITQNCTLQHSGGHKRVNQFTARVGRGPPGSSEAQGDGAAATYAKRQAFCDALNIVVEHDVDGADARADGAPITWEQIEYLREQVKETKSDEVLFLRFAGAKRYEEIGSNRYDSLVAALEKKRT